MLLLLLLQEEEEVEEEEEKPLAQAACVLFYYFKPRVCMALLWCDTADFALETETLCLRPSTRMGSREQSAEEGRNLPPHKEETGGG